jgi:hypothetical protein
MRGSHTRWRSVQRNDAKQSISRDEMLDDVSSCDNSHSSQMFSIASRTIEHRTHSIVWIIPPAVRGRSKEFTRGEFTIHCL